MVVFFGESHESRSTVRESKIMREGVDATADITEVIGSEYRSSIALHYKRICDLVLSISHCSSPSLFLPSFSQSRDTFWERWRDGAYRLRRRPLVDIGRR